MYKYHVPQKLNTNIADINKLIKIYNNLKEIQDEEIEFNFKDTTWMSGELVALFGAICYNLENNYNKKKIYLVCSKNVEATFQSNNFSEQINNMENGHTKSTSILYKNFEEELNSNKLNCFEEYIKDELNTKLELEQEKIDYICHFFSEIFVNARTHGNTHKIFCCGQKYPKINQIRILLVDLGVGIPYNVKNKTNLNMSDIDYILWSLEKGNSTKEEKAAGLGLYNIFEFIKEHNGNISIISHAGQYDYKNGIINNNVDNIFDGTMVYLEFDYASIVDIQEMFKNIKRGKEFNIF